MTIAVVGDCIQDRYISYETLRPCPEGNRPIVREVGQDDQPGGAGAVVKMVIALDEDVRYQFGSFWPYNIRHQVDGQTVFRVDDPIRSPAITPDRIDARFSDGCTVACVADYGRGAVDRRLIESCLSRDWRVIVDPHPTQDPEIYRGAWGICPNRAEDDSANYWGTFDRVCLKLDKDGMMAHDGSQSGTLFPGNDPPHWDSIAEQPPFDVTGCGDQVLATIGVMLSRGKTWIESCRIANIAAGLKCAKRGTTPVTAAELDQALGVESSLSNLVE